LAASRSGSMLGTRRRWKTSAGNLRPCWPSARSYVSTFFPWEAPLPGGPSPAPTA
jgi:hypothetical protein